MTRQTQKTSPGMRLQLGASVLSAARAVDTRLVKARLGRFERAHHRYVEGQRKVDAAESQLRTAQARLGRYDAIQDEALETLACVLAHDGQPRKRPFEAFGASTPAAIAYLPPGESAKAVHQLVETIQRSKTVSKETQQAAQAADKAARDVEQALGPIVKLQDNVRDARRTRDAVGQGWESSLAALRRGARSAADEGAPDLYPTLFPAVVRVTTKTKAPDTPVPDAPPTPTATAA